MPAEQPLEEGARRRRRIERLEEAPFSRMVNDVSKTSVPPVSSFRAKSRNLFRPIKKIDEIRRNESSASWRKK